MPYLKKIDKEKFSQIEAVISCQDINLPGELNYLVTLLCRRYTEVSVLNYGTINDVIGALECVKQEYYRRIASAYENKKIRENGDVYE